MNTKEADPDLMSNTGMVPMDTDQPPAATTRADGSAAPPVFVSLQEHKEQVNKVTKRGNGNSYAIKFFLVDTKGRLHHCVTGMDTGDSHYEYTAESGFPALFCHNKQEVKAWSDRIIANSQAHAGFHTDIVEDTVPADASMVTLPTFVSYKEEGDYLPDGRHVIQWYLIDTEGHGHLAVTGEEKDTKDGHYHYHTETIFNIAAPLQAGNKDVVHRWLEGMIVHPGYASRPGSKLYNDGSTPFSSGGRGGHRGGRSTGGGHHSRGGRHSGRPPTSGRGRGRGRVGRAGDSLLRQATSNMARGRGRGVGAWRQDPDREVRDFVSAELRKWAHEEAVARERVKNAALSYVLGPLEERETQLLNRCLPILTRAAKESNFVPASREATGTGQQQANLFSTIGALRELSHAYAPLALVSYPGMNDTLDALKNHKHPDVSGLAATIIDQWLRTAVVHTKVLSDPTYVHDPRIHLEEVLNNQSEMDVLVNAITHKRLQAPPSATGTPALGPVLNTPASIGMLNTGGAGQNTSTVERRNLQGVLLGTTPGQQQQQRQQGSMNLDNAPSVALVNAPVPEEGDGAEILNDFEQQLAADGVQF